MSLLKKLIYNLLVTPLFMQSIKVSHLFPNVIWRLIACTVSSSLMAAVLILVLVTSTSN